MKIQVFLKISALKTFANFSGKHVRWKIPALQAARTETLLKRDSTLGFSCKNFRNTFPYRATPLAAF